MDIKDTVFAVKNGTTTAQSLVEEALRKAEDSKELNIFLELHSENAVMRAVEIDLKASSGEQLGKLAGIPFAVKDNFLVSVGTTTAASNMLKGYEAAYTSTAVAKLLAEDAVLIGKTNLDAFAHGASTENSDFGPTKNPVDPTKVPGGSSGGSAAVVAAGITPFALGSDTGGSIRLPASFCGVVGFKPSYGLVSRYGVVAMASSTDTIGVLANTVANTSLVMNLLKGQDQFDGTTIDSSSMDLESGEVKPLKIGVIKELAEYDLEPAIQTAFEEGLKNLKDAGHEIVEVSIPSVELALACYYILVPAEISSNLSRYDGVVYGNKAKDAKTLDEAIAGARSTGFGDENKRRIMIGTYVLSSGYYDAYYKKAQRLRTKLVNEYKTAMESADLLVSPVAPFTAFDIGAKVDDPVQMYLVDIMTVTPSLVGAPAVSVPIGLASDMPFGIQLMGGHGDDGLVLNIAKQIGDKK